MGPGSSHKGLARPTAQACAGEDSGPWKSERPCHDQGSFDSENKGVDPSATAATDYRF